MPNTPYDAPATWDDAAIAFPMPDPMLPQPDVMVPAEETDPVRGAGGPGPDAG